MNNTAQLPTPDPLIDAPKRRKRIIRSAIRLTTASAFLIVFILFLGDLRRQERAMNQCRWHATTLTSRLGPAGTLPMNLEPIESPQRVTGMLRLEWLDRDQARALRDLNTRRIVAQTVPILQVVGRDGRGVIVFDDGQFEVIWMTLSEFDKVVAMQDQ
jgi:hypothetical protein